MRNTKLLLILSLLVQSVWHACFAFPLINATLKFGNLLDKVAHSDDKLNDQFWGADVRILGQV